MSEKWVLVPSVATNTMCDAGEGFNIRCGCPDCDLTAWDKVAEGYSAMLSAVPPIPDSVLAEMVERGARAICRYEIAVYPTDLVEREKYMRGYVEEKWHDYTEQAEACLRAALGIDRAAADAVHEPESKP